VHFTQPLLKFVKETPKHYEEETKTL